MQELTMNEINAVSGAGLFSFLGQATAMAAGGFLGAAAATELLSNAAIPYVDALIPAEFKVATYAVAGCIAGAAAMYGLTSQSNSASSFSPYYF